VNQAIPSELYRFIENSQHQPTIKINNDPISFRLQNGYARLSRKWQGGDVVELFLPMPIRRLVAHDSVAADRGRVALQRGPIAYCVEHPDNKDGHVLNLFLPDDTKLSSEVRPDLLNGIQIIKGKVWAYKMGEAENSLEKSEQDFVAIPYYAWAHRGKGEMAVWLAREEAAIKPLGKPTIASTSKVSASYGDHIEAVQDQMEPKNSIDHEVLFYDWWPHKGTTEWIQYDFAKTEEVSTVEVYWFDDTGIGECRVPQTWKILYKLGNEWKPVYTEDQYGIEKDKFNRIVFETVKTKALRLEIQSPPGYAGGIYEWKVK
jgi:hypothetical protein